LPEGEGGSMLERFAKYSLTIFIVVEIGMFSGSGKLGLIQIGPVLASEESVYMLVGLIYSAVMAAYLIYANPLVGEGLRVIGYVSAIAMTAAVASFKHDFQLSFKFYLLGIASLASYWLILAIQLVASRRKNEKENKGE